MSIPELTTQSDDQLMALLASGEVEALGELLKRHKRVAWCVALRFLGDHAAAEDLVQDCFLTLMDKSKKYRAQGRFRAYLLRILTHKAISLKRRPTPSEIQETETLSGPDPVAESMEQRAREARVRGALARLPERQRMALILRFYEELPVEEIASAMDASPKSVEHLLARGRETLSRWLGAYR